MLPTDILHIPELNGIEAYNCINDISSRKLIVDLRSFEEFQQGRIRNAVSIPIEKLWNEYILKEANELQGKLNCFDNEAIDLNIIGIHDKERFWRFVAANAQELLHARSADQWDYRGVVYNQILMYFSTMRQMNLFLTLFRHEQTNKRISSEKVEMQEQTCDELIPIPEESLCTPELTREYHSFSKNLKLIYMKKNNNIKWIMRTNYELFAKQFPFLITTPNSHAIQGELPSMISEYVFLGNQNNAENRKCLEMMEIEYILNMASEIRNRFAGKELRNGDKKWQIIYKKIGIDDTVMYSALSSIQEAVSFIEEVVQMKKRILVHCQLGISRAATPVIAWVMKHNQWDYSRAYNYVRQCRPQTHPNSGFRDILQHLQ